MSKRRWLGRTLIVLVVVGLLIAGGFGLYRLAWWQGYNMSQGMGGHEESDQESGMPCGRDHHSHGMGYSRFGGGPFSHGMHRGHTGSGGGLLGAGLLILATLFVARAFRFHSWRAVGGPRSARGWRRWARHMHMHGHGHGDHCPFCEGHEQAEGEDEPAEPEPKPNR